MGLGNINGLVNRTSKLGSYVLVGTDAGLYILTAFDYAEIWDGAVVMNLAVTGSVQMNRTVATGVVMNQLITNLYSELEGI